jgi:hypothetical protein
VKGSGFSLFKVLERYLSGGNEEGPENRHERGLARPQRHYGDTDEEKNCTGALRNSCPGNDNYIFVNTLICIISIEL